MLHWFLHVTGIDTQQSDFYDFWSGIGPVIFGQLPILASMMLFFRHRNCQVKGCPRLGHPHPDADHRPICHRHLQKIRAEG